MRKNVFFGFGLPAVLLAMGFVLAGCPNDTTEEQDIWSNVTSLDQVNGTWKGSYSQTMTIKEVMENGGQTWTAEMQTVFGNMKVAVTTEMTMIIDSTAGTVTSTIKSTQTYSGGNIDSMWASIGSSTANLPEGFTVDDSKHSITMNVDIPPTPMTDSDLAGMQINQYGTKLKNRTDGAAPEIVFTKQ
ncbi:MAG: hypothetical protein LBI94_01830 [Treponema sp.]|jgi:hypothetical protein|nr:hypothetical protein [Treponema sp.]